MDTHCDAEVNFAISQRLQKDHSACFHSAPHIKLAREKCRNSCATTSHNCHKMCCSHSCNTNNNTNTNTNNNSNPSNSSNYSSHTTIHLSLHRLCALLLLFSLFSATHACGPGRGIGGPRRNRKLTPLVFKQHVPNMSERTLGASGLNEGAIKRDSPKFKNLVPNYNKDIIFKDDEGSGADRLMSRRCKEKLNILAVSVMNQWPGVRLRVTESWDEDNGHNAESLHYEGRAVDITTSDRDRTKYGMLARLAVEAGFDWVYYESRAHIHCSVKSDSSHISHVSGCFTADSTVLTADGIHKRMRELEIGDRVLSMSSSGEPVYSEVILFMDRNLDQLQDFVQIHTENGEALTVTPSHLVLVWRPNQQLLDYVFADRVEENDFVLVHDAHAQLRPQRVAQLRAVQGQGIVAPLTNEGTIVVNSVAASCYAILKSQRLAHMSLAPVRFVAMLRSWLPGSGKRRKSHEHAGVGGKLALAKGAHSNATVSTAAQYNGIHWYPRALYTLKDYVVPQSWRYQ